MATCSKRRQLRIINLLLCMDPSVDIMTIQTHFRYIYMIIHFLFDNEHFKVICLVVCILQQIFVLECTVYEVTANIKIT